MKFLLLLISLLPSLLQVPIRRLLGAKIEPGARISMFAFVFTNALEMGPGARIGPGVLLLVRSLKMGEQTQIRPLSIFKVRALELGDYTLVDPLVLVNCTNGPRSQLKVGRHSRLQSFSQLEPSEGIFIGDHVALGGQCLVFCHGSWSNYLRGSPHSRGSVRIEDEVWVSWRAMILAGSHIGSRAIIGAHSMVHGKVPANALFVGVPARMVVDTAWKPLTLENQQTRMHEIIHAYSGEEMPRLTFRETQEPSRELNLEYVNYTFSGFSDLSAARGTHLDFNALIAYGVTDRTRPFVEFLESYGVRMDRKPNSSL